MTDFAFGPLVSPYSDRITSALGASGSAPLVANDIGKPVKLAGANNHVLCAAGDEIEGFLAALSDGGTVNNGYSLGTVDRDSTVTAKLDAAQAGTVAVGALVVSGATQAVGTAIATYPLVKTGVATNMGGTPPVLGTPVNFKWRIVNIVSGTGVAGDLVTIERVK